MAHPSKATTLTILSNGYGEDSIGSLLVSEFQLQHSELKLQAFPTVDRGSSYEANKIDILGPRKVMPSGGLLMHSLDLFLADMRAGFVQMTVQQLWRLHRTQSDIVLVVGDVYALGLSQLIRCKERYFVQSLVSRYHQIGNEDQKANRYIMENISAPERWLIINTVTQMYVRDELTASWLYEQGLHHVQALGNPMLDALDTDKFEIQFGADPVDINPVDINPVIALLPGTRDYAVASLKKMLAGLDELASCTALVAWARPEGIPDIQGWEKDHHTIAEEGYMLTLRKGTKQVHFFKKRFAAVLESSQLVLGTAGTAHEQAASLGLPIVSFAMPPFYNQSFLDNQKRLLGDALILCDGSSQAISKNINNLLNGVGWEKAVTMGPERMGQAGGSKKIVADILHHSTVI